ncbi:MAG: Ldh family oxidoreductase, partial [Alphaproteobacteria bacterium]
GLDELPAIATSQGIAMLGIRRSHHCGALGCSVERLADAGFIAMMMANSPAAMASWGGSKRLLGTNPMAFAVPLADGPPVVVDLSLSAVSRGRVLAAKQQGEAIPEGWALDNAGNPTTDAGEALEGTMLPFGGPKSTALALIVEFLAAGLTGANFASEASSFIDSGGHPPGVGQLMIAISPSAFGGDAVLGRFAELAAMITDDGDAYLPGRRRQASKEAAMRDGIEVDAGIIAQIATISHRD